MKLYRKLAQIVDAWHRCKLHSDTWMERHEAEVRRLVDAYMPSGSGFDNGTAIDLGRSSGERLVFRTSFHHMNDVGYYDGWTEHDVDVTPSLAREFIVKVKGRNRNDIKDLIVESFSLALCSEVA